MQRSSVSCSNCLGSLPLDIFNTEAEEKCPQCNAETYAFAFPALMRPLEQTKTGEQILIEGDASCFFHPQKKAVVACAQCGRFLCSLCDIDFAAQHICASCLEAGKRKKTIKTLEDKRVLYDDMALALAVLPMLFVYVVIITAPISIFLAIRHWNSPSSIIPRRSKLRMIFAILISSMQLFGGVVLLIYIFSRFD